MHHARIDRLACQTSPIHNLDGRIKLIAVVVFSVFVISLPPTAVSILACYAVWPFTILVIGRIPLKFVLKQILIVSPFVLVLAASSLLYDKSVVSVTFGPMRWDISAGLLRCFSIIGKFVITMSALIGLVATTRFSDLLAAMQKLHLPRLLIVQLGFLYRYIFMLLDKAYNILRARAGRKLRNLGLKMELKTAGAIIGTLFLDSLDTAARVNMAMQARGFSGKFHTISTAHITAVDGLFAATLAVYLLVLHFLARVF